MPKKFIRRRRTKRKGNKTARMAKVALAKATRIDRYIEHHYHENQPSRTLTTTGSVDVLSGIAEGDSSLTRTGLKVTPTSLYLRYKINHGHDGGTPPVLDPQGLLSRVMVVRDTQQISDTSPSVADVLASAGINVMKPLSRLFRDRFGVLYDKVHSTSPGGKAVVYKSTYLKLSSKRPIYFNGTTAADVQKNGLYMITICDDAVYSPTMYTWFRLRYADC